MKFLWRWMKRLLILIVLVALVLIVPIIYIETTCQSTNQSNTTHAVYQSIVAPEYVRPETRTLMTYPEWHIVHSYEEYAATIQQQDPHHFAYFSSIKGFWTSLCAVSGKSSEYGEIDFSTKQMVYVIGSSFTIELVFKALYEETIGRLVSLLRGSERAPLDDISAQQAGQYAKFLQQTPWYKWNFTEDSIILNKASTGSIRDIERRVALGLEYKAKAVYARAIEQAVGNVGADDLKLRMIVSGSSIKAIEAADAITVVSEHAAGLEVEVPRYRALTILLQQLSMEGVDFVEIAGNDDIMFTTISANASENRAYHSIARQGFNNYRHIYIVKVSELAKRLRELPLKGDRLEHIHDY